MSVKWHSWLSGCKFGYVLSTLCSSSHSFYYPLKGGLWPHLSEVGSLLRLSTCIDTQWRPYFNPDCPVLLSGFYVTPCILPELCAESLQDRWRDGDWYHAQILQIFLCINMGTVKHSQAFCMILQLILYPARWEWPPAAHGPASLKLFEEHAQQWSSSLITLQAAFVCHRDWVRFWVFF